MEGCSVGFVFLVYGVLLCDVEFCLFLVSLFLSHYSCKWALRMIIKCTCAAEKCK